MSFRAVNEDVGRVKSRSCYCQDRVPRRDTGARRRVKRLRDSLTPGRANPRQAERARHTERESEREPTVKGTVNFPFASFILNENVPLVFSLVSFPAVFLSGRRSHWSPSLQSWEPRTFFFFNSISHWSWKFVHIVIKQTVFAAAKVFSANLWWFQ